MKYKKKCYVGGVAVGVAVAICIVIFGGRKHWLEPDGDEIVITRRRKRVL